MLIIGDKEAENGMVSVRKQGAEGDIGQMNIKDFTDYFMKALNQ